MKSISQRIAEELGVGDVQVEAAVGLLDGGATVPFVARYRKEATGGLDDAQLRTLEERLGYLRELEDRRAAVLDSVREQGKLDEAPERQIRAVETQAHPEGRARPLRAAHTKAQPEALYLPDKRKRRTRGETAREAGLTMLADQLLAAPE